MRSYIWSLIAELLGATMGALSIVIIFGLVFFAFHIGRVL